MIQNIVTILREMSEKPISAYKGGGVYREITSRLSLGLSSQQKDTLLSRFSFSLPNDYLAFLTATNGVSFHPTESYFYSLEKVLEYTDQAEYQDGILCIGEMPQSVVIINCNELESEEYIYVGDPGSSHEFLALHTDFTSFLDTFLKFNTEAYWEWAKCGEIKYYDFGRKEPNFVIQNTLCTIQKIVEKPITVYAGDGNFREIDIHRNPGLSPKQQKFLLDSFPFLLPEDYHTFLSHTNGIFIEPIGARLYSLEEALENSKICEYQDGIFLLGTLCDMAIVINCNELDSSKYMYVGDMYFDDQFISLNTDFAGFLDTFLRFNADLYWDWVNHGEIKKYNFKKD